MATCSFVCFDVLQEEEIDGKDDAADHEVILQNSEEIDFRQPEQCLMSEEHGQHDVEYA